MVLEDGYWIVTNATTLNETYTKHLYSYQPAKIIDKSFGGNQTQLCDFRNECNPLASNGMLIYNREIDSVKTDYIQALLDGGS